jgi:protein arginine N-methyltransferase 1
VLTPLPGSSYEAEQPWLPASEVITEWAEDFHELLLGDRLRMAAFRTAIREVVSPGATVLDLGTGTGILAQWALEAGAARVYGIDFNPRMLQTAVERITAAGHGAQFRPVHGMSFDVELPERVDVIVSETLGNLADNEGCVRILVDARARFLAEDGALLPARVQSYLVPVAAVRAHESVGRALVRGGDESLTGEQRLSRLGVAGRFDTYYDTIVSRTAHLASPRVVRSYEFTAAERDEYSVNMSFPIRHDGTFTGFKGYFVADLSDTVALDISGDDIEHGLTSDSWKHCYLPVELSVQVQRGDRVALAFSRRTDMGNGAFGQQYRWAGAVLRGAEVVGRFDQRSGTSQTGG